MKIIDALKSVAGETDATTDAMIQILAANGFGADDPADGAFRSLSESRLLHMHFDPRQVAAIIVAQRNVTQGDVAGGGEAGASAGVRAAEGIRGYVIIGPQRRVTPFNASSIITFGDLRRNIQELLPLYSLVEFDVYTEAAVQSVKTLAGMELQEACWRAHLDSLSPTTTVRVVVRARGKPFSEYNGLSATELERLVFAHTGLSLDDGQPEKHPDKFNPPPDFADSEQLLHWGPRVQQAECPACSAPFEAVAAGQGAQAARQDAQAAGQGAQAAGQGALAGQDALAAGRSRGGGEAVPARPDSLQHEEQGATLKLRHLAKTLATSMICLVRSIRSEEIGPGAQARGFINLVLAGALQLAKAVEPRSSGHRLYLKAEPALAGSMAWGKVDYMLRYRAIGIMVVEAKAGNLDAAWGQTFMQMCAMHEAILHRLRHERRQERGQQTVSKGQKRTAAEAFVVDNLSCYALICTASRYRLVLYEPRRGLWWSRVMSLPLSATTTPEQLASPLEKVIRMLAYAITRQMKWVDEGLTSYPELDKPLQELSGADVEDATKDYLQDIAQLQALEEEDDAAA